MQPCEDRSSHAHDIARQLAALAPNIAGVPTYRYSDLRQSSNEVLIEHEGQTYRLRMTRNGKLILNK